ncbi:MAG: hypothetical protein WCL71_13365 [Deltaproteobacteria bacterium]
MTPSQIDKRLDVLESRLSTEYVMPPVWVYFGKDAEVSGWRHKETDEIFWRETNEADDELRDRVLTSTEIDRNHRNGRVFIAVM